MLPTLTNANQIFATWWAAFPCAKISFNTSYKGHDVEICQSLSGSTIMLWRNTGYSEFCRHCNTGKWWKNFSLATLHGRRGGIPFSLFFTINVFLLKLKKKNNAVETISRQLSEQNLCRIFFVTARHHLYVIFVNFSIISRDCSWYSFVVMMYLFVVLIYLNKLIYPGIF